MRQRSVVLLLLVILSLPLHGQSSNPITLSLAPGADIPFGPFTTDGVKLHKIGGSVTLVGEYRFPFSSYLYAEGLVDLALMYTSAETTLVLTSFGAGAGVFLTLLPKIKLKLSATGGYALGIYRGKVGGFPFARGQIQLQYALSPAFSLGLGTSYDYHFGLYNGLGVFLGTAYNLGTGQSRSKVNIGDTRIDPIFPVFYSYYDENPLGSITITNTEKGPVKNVQVSFYVKQYMDQPKLCARIPEIKKNQEKQVPLFALFADNILEITEGTKVNAVILIEYSYLDAVFKGENSQTIQMYDRNAMTWDDNRKAASFITAKDPEILRFSKRIAGQLRSTGNPAVNKTFREALGLFEALRVYGINYVIDPSTPYTELSQNKYSLDYLQFPIQTMSYKAGDCDDLSILYSALLESIGIETAFITVPGHIFIAFSLNMKEAEAEKIFSRPEDLLVHDNKIWIPVEVTQIQDGFLRAWQTGAKEWRENESEGQAAIYPIHTAWATYAPVGMTDSNARIEELPGTRVLTAYTSELERFIEREISDKVEDLRNRIKENDSPKLINKLGILYARFGLYDKAKVEFEKAARDNYAPSLVNMGNLAYLQSDFTGALKYFEQAQRLEADNIAVLLGIAKTNYELENYGSVKIAYRKLEDLSPDTASRFSYLVAKGDETSRASAATLREDLIWDEEP
jgi:tetratricopeptide (TPR) repeat protein